MPVHAGIPQSHSSRRTLVLSAALAALAAPGGAGCFFLEGVNSPPQAQIETVAPGPYFRGQDIAVRADKSDDPDGTLVEVDWQAFTCSADRTACDAPPFLVVNGASPGDHFVVNAPTNRTSANDMGESEPLRIIAVEAEVFDDRGASHRDRVFIDLTNQEPSLQLQSQGLLTGGIEGLDGFPVATAVRILALGTDPDGDALDYNWSLVPPPGSIPGNVQFGPTSAGGVVPTYELIPDIPGTWRVEVTASDNLEGEDDTHIDLDVEPDHPPCIRSQDPDSNQPGARYIVDRNAPARRFALLNVKDDLDSHPQRQGDELTDPFFGSARFRWQIASPDTAGQFIELAGHDLADYLFDAAAFVPGDQIALRVDALDRVARTLNCGDEQPTCALVTGCMQRITWYVEVR